MTKTLKRIAPIAAAAALAAGMSLAQEPGAIMVTCKVAKGGGLNGCTASPGQGVSPQMLQAALVSMQAVRLPEQTQAALPVGSMTMMPVTLRRLIAEPQWARQPGAGEIIDAYPAQARRRGTNGHAILLCTASGAGAMEQCVVSAQSPADSEFGKAALSLAPLFTLKTPAADGQPVDGVWVYARVSFDGASAKAQRR